MDGTQVRPLDRSDFLEVLGVLDLYATNGLDPGVIEFDGLDLKGADLRGLNLSRPGSGRFSFQNCNMQNVLASPQVIRDGEEFDFGDPAYGFLVNLWEAGETEALADYGAHVQQTCLDGAWFMGANLNHAVFSHGKIRKAVMWGINAERVQFKWSDLRGTDLRWAEFTNSNFESSRLQEAELYGTQFRDSFLDGIHWGEKQAVVQETRGHWEAAWTVYRRLAAVHETAALTDVAAEFRFRRERALTKVLLDQAISSRSPGEELPNNLLRAFSTGPRRHTFLRWISHRFMEWLFGFGERPLRVIRAIVLVVLAFAPFYFVSSGWDVSVDGMIELSARVGKAVYFSAASTTALGYGSWVGLGDALGWRVYLGAIQSFLGLFLNALFLVTFTRRWLR